MTVYDLAKQINFTLEQVIQICNKNNINISEGTHILSEEDINNLINFLQNTPMISVEEFAKSVNLSIEEILDCCKEIELNLDSKDDLLFEEDIEKLTAYLQEMSSSSSGGSAPLMDFNEETEEWEYKTFETIEDLCAFTGFMFKPDVAAAAKGKITPINDMISSVNSALETASFIEGKCTAYGRAKWYANQVSSFFQPFIIKFETFIRNMSELTPGFEEIYNACLVGDYELAEQYLDDYNDGGLDEVRASELDAIYDSKTKEYAYCLVYGVSYEELQNAKTITTDGFNITDNSLDMQITATTYNQVIDQIDAAKKLLDSYEFFELQVDVYMDMEGVKLSNLTASQLANDFVEYKTIHATDEYFLRVQSASAMDDWFDRNGVVNPGYKTIQEFRTADPVGYEEFKKEYGLFAMLEEKNQIYSDDILSTTAGYFNYEEWAFLDAVKILSVKYKGIYDLINDPSKLQLIYSLGPNAPGTTPELWQLITEDPELYKLITSSDFQSFLNCTSYDSVERDAPLVYNYMHVNRETIMGYTPLSFMCYQEGISYNDWEWATYDDMWDAYWSAETKEEQDRIQNQIQFVHLWKSTVDPNTIAQLGCAYETVSEMKAARDNLANEMGQIEGYVDSPIDVPDLETFMPEVVDAYKKGVDEGIFYDLTEFNFTEYWMSYPIGYVIYNDEGIAVQIITEEQAKANPELIDQKYNGKYPEPCTLGDLYVNGQNGFMESEVYLSIVDGINSDPNFYNNFANSDLYKNSMNSIYYITDENAALYQHLSSEKSKLDIALSTDLKPKDNPDGSDASDNIHYIYEDGSIYNIAALDYVYGAAGYIVRNFDDLPFDIQFDTQKVLDQLYADCVDLNFSSDQVESGGRGVLLDELKSWNGYYDGYVDAPNDDVCGEFTSCDWSVEITDLDTQYALLLALLNGNVVNIRDSYDHSKPNEDGYVLTVDPENAQLSLIYDGYYGKKIDLTGNTVFLDAVDWIGDKYAKNGLDIISERDAEVLNLILSLSSNNVLPNGYTFLLMNEDLYNERWRASQINRDTLFARSNAVWASIESVLAGAGEGINATINSYSAYFNGKPIDIKDVYSSSDIYRSAVSTMIAENHTGEFLGFGLDDLYNTGMSIADTLPLMAVSAALPGLGITGLAAGIVGFSASTALMGSRAYVSTLNDALSRGISDGKAIFLATSSALAESVMEYISAGSFVNMALGENAIVNAIVNKLPIKLQKIGNVLLSMAYQGLEEGIEEGQTEVFNIFADKFISGDLSNIALAIDEKMSLNPNLTYDEAMSMVVNEMKDQILESFKGGFLSGLVFGAAGSFNSNTSDSLINIVEETMLEYTNSSYNADSKQIRADIRNGDYVSAMRHILESDSLTASQKYLTNMRLYNNLVSYGITDLNGLTPYLNAGIRSFTNLNISEQLDQYNVLDSTSQLVLFNALGDGKLDLFNSMDLNAQKSLFSKLSIDEQLYILTNIDENIRNELLPKGKNLFDFIINNKFLIVDSSIKLNDRRIVSCKDRIKSILEDAGIKINDIDSLLNKIATDSVAFDNFMNKYSAKIDSGNLSDFTKTLDSLKQLFANIDKINDRKNLNLDVGKYKNDAELNKAKYELACKIYPEGLIELFNIYNVNKVTTNSGSVKTDSVNVTTENSADNDSNNKIYHAVAEILNSNGDVDVLAKYEGDADYDAIIAIVDDINARLENLERTVADNMIGDAKKNAVVKALKEYCDVFGLKITEAELSSFIEIDSDGNIPSRNISELGKLLERKSDSYTRDIVADLYEFIQSPMYEESTRIDADAISNAVKLACADLKNQIFITLASGTITDINAYLDSVLGNDLNVDSTNVENLAINNAVADILSTENPMQSLKQYEGDINYDAIFEKVSDALAVVDKVFDANAKTEVDAARRAETITQLMDYFNENNIPVTEGMLNEIIGDAGIDVNNVQDTRDTVNNLGKVIADVTGQHIQDAVNGLYNFIQGDTFSSSIQIVEDTALGDLQVKTDLILENLVLGVTNGTITDINAYLNGVLESSGLDITIDSNQEIGKNDGGTTVIGDGTIHVDGNENIDVVSDEEVTVDGVVETGNNENTGGFSNNGITGDGIDTDNAETSGKDHFDNVSGIVPIGLKSDTDDMGDNRTDKKLNEKDNKTNNNSSEEITQDDNKKDDKKDNKNQDTINDKKKQFMAGIEAMDNKSGDAGVGLRAIYDYLVNDNFKGITTAGKFRQFIRSMDRATLIKFYNEMAIDYNNSHSNDLLLMVQGNIVNGQTGNLFNYFVKLHNFIVNILNDNRAMSLKMFQNNSSSLKILVNKFGNIIENLMSFNNMDTKIDSTDDSYNSLKTLLLECKNAINEFANMFGNLGKSTKGKGLKIPTYLSSIFSNISDTLNSALEYVNQLYNEDINLDKVVESEIKVTDSDTVNKTNEQTVVEKVEEDSKTEENLDGKKVNEVSDKLKYVSDSALHFIIKSLYNPKNAALAKWIENGNFSDSDLLRILSSLNKEQLNYLEDTLELKLKYEIANKIGFFEIDLRVESCIKFIESELISVLKSMFPMVSDVRFKKLLDVIKLYTDERSKMPILGKNSAATTNAFIGIKINVDTWLKYSNFALKSTIIHEAIRFITYGKMGFIYGFDSVIVTRYLGFNEAVTEYFSGLLTGDDVFVNPNSSNKKSGMASVYEYAAIQIRDLVNLGIFNLNDLINAYANNNYKYVDNILLKYLDGKKVRLFYECLNELTKHHDISKLNLLRAELDQYITEIAENYEKSLLEVSETHDMPIDSKDSSIPIIDSDGDTGKVTDGDSFNIDLRNKLENLGTVINNLVEKITSNAKLWASNEFHRHVEFLQNKIGELRILIESLKSKSDSSIDVNDDSYDTENTLVIEAKKLIQNISSYIQTLGSKIKNYGSKISKEFSNIFKELMSSLDSVYEEVNQLYNGDGIYKPSVPKKYNSLTQLQVDVAEGNQVNKNFKGLVSSFINALKFNSNVDLYGTLVDYGTTKKNVPTLKEFNRFNDKTRQYSYTVQNGAFHHFKSLDIQDDTIYKKTFDVKHRLYINADFKYTYKFFEYFIDKCNERNIPFYFKTGYFTYNSAAQEIFCNGNVCLDETLTRSESGVIYAPDQYIVDYTNICLEIAAEHPELKFMAPPAVTSAIDGWLGYGMDPVVHDSFNNVRAKVFNDAIFNGVNSFISANGNLTCSNEMTVNQLMIQLLYKKVLNSYKISGKQAQQQLWQHISSNMDFYVAQLNSGSKFKLGNMYDISIDMISGIKYQLCSDFLANSELVYRAIYDAFIDSCKKFNVDPNNFALNATSRNNSIMSYDDFLGIEKTGPLKINLQFFGGNVDSSNKGNVENRLINDVDNAIKVKDLDKLSSIMAKLSVDNLKSLFKDSSIKTFIEDMVVTGQLEIMDSTLLNEIIKGLSKDKLAIAVNSDSLKSYICTMFIDGDLVITDNVILNDVLNNMSSYQVELLFNDSKLKSNIISLFVEGKLNITNSVLLTNINSSIDVQTDKLSNENSKENNEYELKDGESLRDKVGLQFFADKIEDSVSEIDTIDHPVRGDSVGFDGLRINNPDIVEQSNKEVQTIKKEIFANMPSNLADLAKCRYLYMELNKRVSYEYGYFSFEKNSVEQRYYYNQNVSFDTLIGNKVICKGWSQLYKELLLDAGIAPSRVSICGPTDVGAHRWVEVEFPDFILRADATDAFEHSIDVSASKSGSKTYGFIDIPKKYAGINIKMKVHVVENNQTVLKTIYDILPKDDSWLRTIDSHLGYISSYKYFNEIVADLHDDFYSPDVVNRIFGRTNIDAITAKYNFFMNLSIPKNMNSYDAYVYLSQVKHAMFGKDRSIEIDLSFRPNVNSFVPVGAVSILKYEYGYLTCKFYDDVYGSWEVKFINKDEYKKYIDRLGYWK